MLNNRRIWYVNALLAGIVLWLAYRIWVVPRQDAWHFIPDNAFLVIESSKLQGGLYQKKDTLVEAIGSIPFLYDATEHLSTLATDLDAPQRNTLLANKLISYSLHREAKRNLTYVVYVPINSGDQEIIEALEKKPALGKRVSKQTTDDITITRIKRPNEEADFAYFVHDDFLVGSRSVILLEAVIAKIKSGTPALDKVPFRESRQSYAHLFFRTRNLLDVSDLLPTELSPNLRSYFRNIVPFNPDLVLDKVIDRSHIQGYVASKSKVSVPFLSAFGVQRASAFRSASLITDNTSFLIRTSFHDGSQLSGPMNDYLKKKDEKWQFRKDSVQRLLGIRLDDFLRPLSQEAILCEMETIAKEPSQKIGIFYADRPDSLASLLDTWATTADRYHAFKSQPFSLFKQLVRKIEIAEIPALLFGSTFSGFTECYYTVVGKHVIMASSQDAMNAYLSKLSLGNTWANSPVHRKLLKNLRNSAQITVVISPQRIWNNIYYSLPDRWQQAVNKHEQRFKEIRLLAVENFVHREQFGTKIHIHRNAAHSRLANQLLLQSTLPISQPVVAQPFILQNPATRREEVVVQTAAGLHLLDASGKEINQLPVMGELQRPFITLDYRQNGRPQYLTYSAQQLIVLERTPAELIHTSLGGFAGGIRRVAYLPGRIYVADGAGNIHRIENNQKPVKLPIKPLAGGLVDFYAFSYKNQNYLAALLQDGTLTVMYEKDGIPIRGFPKQLVLNGVAGNLVVDTDAQGQPFFKVLSSMGEVKNIAIDGSQRESQQLERLAKEATFELLYDQQHRDWLLVQRVAGQLKIYDKLGKELLTADNPSYSNLTINFYDLGNDWRLITIFDGQNTTLYDLKGKQFGGKPLPATRPPFVSMEEYFNKMILYNPIGDKLEKWGIKVQ